MERQRILLKKISDQTLTMSDTIVLQSHRQPLPYPWLEDCLHSVQSWAEQNKYDYKFIGDELFNPVSDSIMKKTKHQKVIATDLARLIALQAYLQQGYQTAIWCDADFLIFGPDNFNLPESSYALGREVWVQKDNKEKLRAYNKVHNAFLMFRSDNSFLEFYIDSASRLLELNSGPVPPQFIGPKLLTALHNIIQCPVLETAGMLSPLVLQDILNGYGPSLDKFKNKSPQPVTAVNLCSSLVTDENSGHIEMNRLIVKLLTSGHHLFCGKSRTD